MTKSLPERLRIGKGLPPSAGIRAFLHWWGRSLLAWLPRRWRFGLGLDRGRLLMQVDGDALQLRLQDGDGIRELARLPAMGEDASLSTALTGLLAPALQELPRWLLLPASVALRRRMPLPVAAADRLREVVGFEIERQTPFSVDAVAYDARVVGRREGDAQLDVELVVVPRTVLATAEAALGDLVDGLAGIDVLASDGAPLQINLLASEKRRQQADPMRRWNVALAIVALLALSAMLWQVLQNRRAAAAAFEQVAARQAVAARAVAQRRQQLVDLVEGQAFLQRERARRPTVVEVLDELTRKLPDNTSLDKLGIESDRLTLIGRSSEASALIGRLEGSRLWSAPTLTGALQPDARTGRDIFTLTADLAVTGKPAEPPNGTGN